MDSGPKAAQAVLSCCAIHLNYRNDSVLFSCKALSLYFYGKQPIESAQT